MVWNNRDRLLMSLWAISGCFLVFTKITFHIGSQKCSPHIWALLHVGRQAQEGHELGQPGFLPGTLFQQASHSSRIEEAEECKAPEGSSRSRHKVTASGFHWSSRVHHVLGFKGQEVNCISGRGALQWCGSREVVLPASFCNQSAGGP